MAYKLVIIIHMVGVHTELCISFLSYIIVTLIP